MQAENESTPLAQPPTKATSLLHDRWLLAVVIVLVALYAYLAQLKPGGEGFGRGWNMIAYFIYGSPIALIAAGISLWRSAKTAGLLRILAFLMSAIGFAFPVIAIIVMRMRS